jgi:O-antigen/teichoic acid export membrane protein
LGQSIIDIFTYIGSLGDGKGMIIFGAIHLSREDFPRLKGTVIGFLLVSFSTSAFLSAIIFIFSDFIALKIFNNLVLANVFRMFSLGMPFYVLSIGSTAVAIAFHKVKYKLFIQDLCQPLVSIIVVAVLFILGFRLFGALLGFVLSSVVSALLGIILIKRSFSKIFINAIAIFEIKKLLIYSVPVIFIVSVYFFIFEIDKIMLGIMRSAGEVGIYSVASNIAMNILVFYGIFEASFSPVIAQLYHHAKLFKLRKLYKLVAFWSIWLGFLPCIYLMVFGREIISLFGNDFRIGEGVLIILTAAFFVEIASGQTRQLLQMSAKQNIEFVNSLVCVFVNIGLNIVLIPLFGAIGASLATFSSLLIISVIRLIEIKIIFDFVPFSPRHLKFAVFSLVFILIYLGWIGKLGLVSRSVFAVLMFVIFVLISFKLATRDDYLVWGLLKRRIFIKNRG